ncbi:MAG: hypothetical protein FWE94_06785 [Coriobacteriia bacterium]|nr:hypothetical protein [Coriobacteriia bacterium]
MTFTAPITTGAQSGMRKRPQHQDAGVVPDRAVIAWDDAVAARSGTVIARG